MSKALQKIRRICLSLPDTKETLTWGEPHFRVGEKIFAGYGSGKGKPTLGLRLEMEHARAMIDNDPRFTKAPYVGNKGWVSIDVGHIKNWREIGMLIEESYSLIAQKRSVKKMKTDESEG